MERMCSVVSFLDIKVDKIPMKDKCLNILSSELDNNDAPDDVLLT